MIYLDNNATTQPDPDVIRAIQPWLGQAFANPNAAYASAQHASEAIEQAREKVAALLSCRAGELIFTASASESIATAISSALAIDRQAHPRPMQPRTIVTSAGEHATALSACEVFAERFGYELRVCPLTPDGVLDLHALDGLLDESSALLSLVWANNETGAINPVDEIDALAHARGVPMHWDGVQAAGKIPLALNGLKAARYASFSAHKLHGILGAGALFLRRGTRFSPLLPGGHQERGLRAGTQNLAALVAFGVAAEQARKALAGGEMERVASLRDSLQRGLIDALEAQPHATQAERLPNTLSIAFPNLRGEAQDLLSALDQRGIAASAGAACTTGSLEPSHVLKAMTIEPELAARTLRFSLSHQTTEAEILRAIELIVEAHDACSSEGRDRWSSSPCA